MDTQQRIFAHCNACGGDRDQDVHREHVVTSDGDQNSPTFWHKYQIIECRGCHRTSFRSAFSHDENTDDKGVPFETAEQYPPATYRVPPKWFGSLDQKQAFAKLFQEVYIALQNGTTAIAAMGIRAIIEMITIERVKDNGTFAHNIKMLKEGGYILHRDERLLLSALEVGNAAIHRGYSPRDEQVALALDVVEHLIQAIYIFPKALEASMAGIPPDPRKKKV